jgi:hypothetical protein
MKLLSLLFLELIEFVQYSYYSVGLGLRVLNYGGYPNDNVDDSNATLTISILLVYDNGSFENKIRSSIGVYPQTVAVDDFNGDDLLDIVVANYNDSTLNILLEYDNGSFTKQITCAIRSSPQSVAVGDFNNDTLLDIVIAIADPHLSILGVLLGYRNGSFANETAYETGSHPVSVAVSNFNRDARLDIVVTNFGDKNINVLLGYSNVAFVNQTMFTSELTRVLGRKRLPLVILITIIEWALESLIQVPIISIFFLGMAMLAYFLVMVIVHLQIYSCFQLVTDLVRSRSLSVTSTITENYILPLPIVTLTI